MGNIYYIINYFLFNKKINYKKYIKKSLSMGKNIIITIKNIKKK